MGTYLERSLESDASGYGSRRARSGGTYRAYVPVKLRDMPFVPDEATAVALADAAETTARVDEYIRASGTTAVLSVLSKSESIASSLMEEIEGSTHNVIMALDGEGAANDAVASVVKNINITDDAIRRFAASDRPISVQDIVELQADLIQHVTQSRVRGTAYVGIKTAQNRIGGDSLLDAAFVPTPPELMDEYLADLVEYMNTHPTVNPVVACAFAHAQFETLHPFADGNGRTGRAIIQGMLRRDGVVRHSVFPLSTILKERSSDYIAGLESFRRDGDAETAEINAWIRTFAYALADAAELAKNATDQILALRDHWRGLLHGIRSDAVEHRAIEFILERLAVHSGSLAEHCSVSEETARNALSRLESLGIVDSRTRRRRRIYFSPAIVEIIDTIEASPSLPDDARAPMDESRCGAFMPKSREYCTLRRGHPGHHQHKASPGSGDPR
jgi:Fic family protein